VRTVDNNVRSENRACPAPSLAELCQTTLDGVRASFAAEGARKGPAAALQRAILRFLETLVALLLDFQAGRLTPPTAAVGAGSGRSPAAGTRPLRRFSSPGPRPVPPIHPRGGPGRARGRWQSLPPPLQREPANGVRPRGRTTSPQAAVADAPSADRRSGAPGLRRRPRAGTASASRLRMRGARRRNGARGRLQLRKTAFGRRCPGVTISLRYRSYQPSARGYGPSAKAAS
jgi:hypothetical protein